MAWNDYQKAYDIIQQSLIIVCLKMYKKSDEVINFIEKTMKTWEVESTLGGRSLAEAKVQRGIFQGDAQSLLIFIIAVMPLNNIRRKCSAGYKHCKSQEKIHHQMYMDDIQLLQKMKKNWKIKYTLSEYAVGT